VGAKSCPGANGQPATLRGCTVVGLVAIDQPEARFAFIAIDVKANTSAVGQLAVAPRAHQLTTMGIGLALEEYLGDPALESIDLDLAHSIGVCQKRSQLSDVSLDSLGKLNLDHRSGFASHRLAKVYTQIGERLGTVFGALGSSASNSLCCKSFDFVIDLPIPHSSDLALHLAHLQFEIAQHLKKLPGFRPRKERHFTQDSPATRCNCRRRAVSPR
jgi:hypothetical protein